jgi:hypothetical protein
MSAFRTTAFAGENRYGGKVGQSWNMEIQQSLELAIAQSGTEGSAQFVVAKISLTGRAVASDDPSGSATFTGEYQAEFTFPSGIANDVVHQLLESEDYQYSLLSQAYPLAMAFYKRELGALGFDTRHMPVGL